VLTEGNNWLVLYQSQDVHGNAIATSGIIALPQTPPPAGGYPVISRAHGTVGVADLCAPSRDQPDSLAHPMNAYPQTLLNALLQNGYAVAMTDYEGLGTTDRTHPYLLGQSEAYGVLDIVRAGQRRSRRPTITCRCCRPVRRQRARTRATPSPRCSCAAPSVHTPRSTRRKSCPRMPSPPTGPRSPSGAGPG
jgi:hypothetical protein